MRPTAQKKCRKVVKMQKNHSINLIDSVCIDDLESKLGWLVISQNSFTINITDYYPT